MNLLEFATQSAINDFIASKANKMPSFDDCLAQSDTLISAINNLFNKLESLIISPNACNGSLSLDDILLFPILRNLTCVKGLNFPTKIKAYLQALAKQSKIDLFFDRAI